MGFGVVAAFALAWTRSWVAWESVAVVAEEEVVVGSGSRRLAELAKNRVDVVNIDGAEVCTEKPCFRQRAIGRATW